MTSDLHYDDRTTDDMSPERMSALATFTVGDGAHVEATTDGTLVVWDTTRNVCVEIGFASTMHAIRTIADLASAAEEVLYHDNAQHRRQLRDLKKTETHPTVYGIIAGTEQVTR